MAEPGARERLLRDGYLIFRSILPAATLERMRISTAALVEQHKDLHGLQGQHDKGCFAGTMSPYVEPLASAVDSATAEWVEFWAGEASPVHKVKSHALSPRLSARPGPFPTPPAVIDARVRRRGR